MISVGSILHETYRIDEELGRGGMGCVFAATHMRLPRRVAVKVLMRPPEGQALNRFRREAEICSQIGHHSIVEVFDFNEVDGQPYIVMELLTGESLRQRLDKQPRLARPTLIQLVREVGEALAAAHAADVVHRDLKPANLFICSDGKGKGEERFKILDFGISKIVGMLSLQTRDDHLLGTPGYMSPEQARGDVQSVDARSDQFSLATIVYEALSGQPAFVSEGDTPYTVLYKIVHRDPPPLLDQPPELRAALARALAKDPAARYANVTEMAEALVAALARVPDTRPYVPLREVRRRRRWPLLVTAAIVAASVGLGAVALQRARRRAAEAAASAPTRPTSPTSPTSIEPPAVAPSLPPTNTPRVATETAEPARPTVKAEAVAPAAHVDAPAQPKTPPVKSGSRPTSRPAPPRPPKSKSPRDDDELSNPYRERP